jgi:uncharacterized membrane protein YphA (DoxX/SURF4 family)
MPDPLLRVAAAVLGVTFVWAALAKIARWGSWRAALRGYDLPGAAAAVAAPAVPVVEGVAAALLLLGRTKIGAALTVALLAGFSAALLHARQRKGNRLPCGCFGRATERDYRLMLLRNAAIGVLAASLLLAGDDVWFARGVARPSPDELVPALLVVAGLALCLWLVRHALGSFYRKRSS